MTEQTNQNQVSEEQAELINQFNQTVNNSILELFKLNYQMMNDGVTATAVSLANALAAADLVAAMIVENNQSVESIDVMLESLITDMRSRSKDAYKFYVDQKQKREAAAEEQQEAVNA